jgi:hypothetical protein
MNEKDANSGDANEEAASDQSQLSSRQPPKPIADPIGHHGLAIHPIRVAPPLPTTFEATSA